MANVDSELEEPQNTLFNILVTSVTDELEEQQDPQSGGYFGSLRLTLDVFTPYHNIFGLVSDAAGRIQTTSDTLRDYKANGTLHGWVVPSLAAQSFEGLLQACIAYWRACGPLVVVGEVALTRRDAEGKESSEPRKVRLLDVEGEEEKQFHPQVTRFVKEQVHLFASTICREPIVAELGSLD